MCAENIKVRFYETDEYENVMWEDWGRFSEADVHHQYAIALKTPPYRSKDIEKSVSKENEKINLRDILSIATINK